jgi:hypothetical protein
MNITRRQDLLLLSLVLMSTAVMADPMRPLAVPGKPGASSPTAEPLAPRPAGNARPPDRLVAIRQDSRGQRQALIGERWVAVGDKLDGTTVAAIGPNQVDLKSGKSRSTLHLLPPLQASGDPPNVATTLADAARGTGTRRAGSTTR